MSETKKRFRIWAQGATHQTAHGNYLNELLPHMQSCLDPDFELTFHTIEPPVTTVHALTEFRFSREVIRGAIEAERTGCDIFFMNHFQDVGLYEARSAVSIPVLGLGETTLLHSCMLGRKLGLLAINPAFIPAHADQVTRYGLQNRVVGIRAINANISDYMEAFKSSAKKEALAEVFNRQARRLMDDGAGWQHAPYGANIDGAPIVNGVTILVKAAEMALKLKMRGGIGCSRVIHSGYALPSPQALQEFLAHG